MDWVKSNYSVILSNLHINSKGKISQKWNVCFHFFTLIWHTFCGTQKNAPPSCFSKSVWRNIFCGRQKNDILKNLWSSNIFGDLWHFSTNLLLSEEKVVKTTWEWENYDRIFNFGWLPSCCIQVSFHLAEVHTHVWGKKVYKNTHNVILLWLL